jgi:hypothetical protein
MWTHKTFDARRADERAALQRLTPAQHLARLQEMVAATEVKRRALRFSRTVNFTAEPDAWAVTHWGLRGGIRVHFHVPTREDRSVVGKCRVVHELKLGDVVSYSLQAVRCVTHDCLYVGKGYVVTFTRTNESKVGEVRLVDLNEHTMNGRLWTVLRSDLTHDQRLSAVCRALDSVGRLMLYDTRWFNCQHVCTAWTHGTPASKGAHTIQRLVFGLGSAAAASLLLISTIK